MNAWLDAVQMEELNKILSLMEKFNNIIIKIAKDTGLKSGHAYAILDVFDFKHDCKNYH